MQSAQEAISALEWKGIDALRISVGGDALDEAVAEAQPIESEKRFVGRAVARSLLFGAVGAVTAAVLGALLSLIPGVGLDVWTAMVWGAIAGGTIGAIIAAESALHVTRDWELTFEDEERPLTVTVVSDEPKDVERAEEVLRSKAALEVRTESA